MRALTHLICAGALASAAMLTSATETAAQEKKDGHQLLVAFGASVGGLLVESHDKVAACELAAGHEGSNIKNLEAKLTITSNLMKVLIDNMDKARDDKILSDDDRRFVVRAIETAKLVQNEANALKAAIAGKDPKDAIHYQDCRKKADQEIRVLLGIKK